jgi:Spy/CpxP family protein refolding chaperone
MFSGKLFFASVAAAQSSQMKGDIAQLAMDVRVGMDHSTLTPDQKAQFRDDFKELMQAHRDHRTFAALRAARSIRTTLDSGAFRPEDRDRIKQDMQNVKEAHENLPQHGM